MSVNFSRRLKCTLGRLGGRYSCMWRRKADLLDCSQRSVVCTGVVHRPCACSGLVNAAGLHRSVPYRLPTRSCTATSRMRHGTVDADGGKPPACDVSKALVAAAFLERWRRAFFQRHFVFTTLQLESCCSTTSCPSCRTEYAHCPARHTAEFAFGAVRQATSVCTSRLLPAIPTSVVEWTTWSAT
jgi:hypothetical protein